MLRELKIYFEGGGDQAAQRTLLRQGMNEFLKDLRNAANNKGIRLDAIPCGGRQAAYKAFINAVTNAPDGTLCLLLVDSEEAVSGEPRIHLNRRDGWTFQNIDADQIHLMAQTMETWIVADPETLKGFYGQHFLANTLPRAQNLEEVAKRDIETALERATERTQKGSYHKIKHGSELLRKISPEKTKTRCPHCRRFFQDIFRFINEAS